MIRHSLTVLVAVLAFAWAAPVPAETFSVELSEPGIAARLIVEIEWGSIRVTGSADAAAVTIQSIPDQPDEVAGSLISVSEKDNLVSVRQAPLASGSFRSANLSITAPTDIALELTMNRGGDIWVQGIAGLVEVTNLNGSVELSDLSRAAAVNASNGSIIAGFIKTDPDRDMIFTSLNGSIELCLPSDYSGNVDLTTSGDPIRSDFPIERSDSIHRVSPGETLAVEKAEIKGTVGSGGAVIRASTLNGEIALARCQ